MTSPLPTELAYEHGESIGMALVGACGLLSLISVSSMFVILGMSAIRSRHSSEETPFARTHIGIYFLSLLICNLAQAASALLNIPWIIENRIYTGEICEIQGTIEQIGSVGTAIFSFLIAAHTFSLLVLRRQWSDRTSSIALIVSWCVLLLDICIGKFILAEKAYYGITSHWCLLTPTNSTVTYTSDILFMFASAGFSLILYLLVFFRLRGNITVSGGYKIHFHQRPKVRVGRTNAGAYIVTDDRRVESHLTTVGKQMLWHPIAYTLLVLPFAASRCSSFSGLSVPFPVTTFTAAVFVLGGFVNVVLFCTTRSVLPERWRQRLGIRPTLDSGRSDASLPSRRSSVRRTVECGSRKGGVGIGRGMDNGVLDISIEKDLEIHYNDRGRSPSSLRFSAPTTPLRAHRGRQRADRESYHIRHLSFSPRNETLSIRSGDSGLSAGGHSASVVNGVIKQVPDKPTHLSDVQESSMHEPPLGLGVPASLHPFDTVPPVNPDLRHARPLSVLTFEAAVYRSSFLGEWRLRGQQ